MRDDSWPRDLRQPSVPRRANKEYHSMKNAKIQRCFTYRRVGTSDQPAGGSALDVQSEALVRFAASINAPLVLDFVEVASGAGGTRARRMEQERMLDAVGPGDVVAVTRLDRISRDLAWASRNVDRILDKGARFMSLAEGEFDRSPAGRLNLSILTFFARKG
jgi:putative DNA-invertase from lambdoid prophage Rac